MFGGILKRGCVDHFNGCKLDCFGKANLERLVSELGYVLPIRFWLRPKGETLKHGKRLLIEQDVADMLHDMLIRNYRFVDVYLIMPEKIYEFENEIVDALEEILEEEPAASQLTKQSQAQFKLGSGQTSSHKNSEAQFEHYLDQTSSYSEAHYGISAPEAQAEIDLIQTNDEAKLEDDDEFVEEEYALDEGELRQQDENITNSSQWWGPVNNVCNKGDDAQFNCAYVSEDDLRSLNSDTNDDDGSKRKGRKEYYPKVDWKDFKFEPYLEFACVIQLREALVENFIHNNKEFKYVMNDQVRVKAVCKPPGCKWSLYGRV
ncbi:hypothetical protein G4B88_020188 [Cannabis sativa]|uniref:Transposase MuDR plant domain-containing protein n=1 Tax=Cannabis sativa TaxID=3483 RepID=A0A7J6FG43_CANSA|nr:hypothetical protein G4B88_020188 [Cannabis sativa]